MAATIERSRTSAGRPRGATLLAGCVATLVTACGCQSEVGDPAGPSDSGAGSAPTGTGGTNGLAGTNGSGAGRSPTGTGGANGLAGANGSGAGGSPTGTGGTGSTPVDVGDVTGVDPQQLPDGVPGNSRVLRLSYEEYDRALTDLLHLPVSASANFPAEQPNLGPYVGYGELRVNERLSTELERSATSLAERVVSSPEAYAAVVGCAPSAASCRDEFIDDFGMRAYRRPLSSTEQTRFRALFARGAELVASGDAFRDGVQLTLQAMLQSPKLLYRIESGDGTSDALGARLSGFEVATRLSFMLAGTAPDAELLAAAREGALSTPQGIAAQARRLVATPAFEERTLSFHERWMQLDELGSVVKDVALYPSFSPALLSSMRSEAVSFLRAVTLEGNGAVSELLTSRVGFVDERLAPLYGLSGSFGAELVRVEHTPESGRRGLFTRAAFLASHSSNSSKTSPILRGVFLLRRVACANIPDPPPGAQMEQPDAEPATPVRTTRDYFAWKTSMPACAGCHSLINPTGFAFEEFDGLGQWREQESDAPIDSSGTLRIGAKVLAFRGASELLEGIAHEPQVQACYAKNWLQFAYGRAEDQADSRALGLASERLQAGNFSIRDLAVALTERPAFNHLPPKAE